jgi:hypothetical protein
LQALGPGRIHFLLLGGILYRIRQKQAVGFGVQN